jgi:hypothetical protein
MSLFGLLSGSFNKFHIARSNCEQAQAIGDACRGESARRRALG